MKNVFFIGLCAFVLLVSGCAQKEASASYGSGELATESTQVQAPDVSNTSVNDTSKNSADAKVSFTRQDIESKLGTVLFGFDKSNIKEDMIPVVKNNFQVLSDDAKGYTIKLAGNCDDRGSDEYNYDLGLRRATSVKKQLINLGVDKDKIMIVSYGKSNPVCNDNTNSCYQKNRRVDFVLMPSS